MYNGKIAVAAAALAVLVSGGVAQAGPWDHGGWARHDTRQLDRPVERWRVFTTLRDHRYSNIGEPYFLRGHYVVRSRDRFGRISFVEIDPRSGAFIGEINL